MRASILFTIPRDLRSVRACISSNHLHCLSSRFKGENKTAIRGDYSGCRRFSYRRAKCLLPTRSDSISLAGRNVIPCRNSAASARCEEVSTYRTDCYSSEVKQGINAVSRAKDAAHGQDLPSQDSEMLGKMAGRPVNHRSQFLANLTCKASSRTTVRDPSVRKNSPVAFRIT